MYLRTPPPPPRSVPPRRPRVRDGRLYALSAASLGVIAVLGLRSLELPVAAPVDENDRLRIELVHRPEPAIKPGGLIDVGELVDEFEGPPPAPPAAGPYDEWAWVADWEEGSEAFRTLEPAPVPPWRVFADALFGPPPPPPPPRPGDDRRFGFDDPRPDWRAEREARRARLEALDRQMRAGRDRGPDPIVLPPDADPYADLHAEADPGVGFGG